MVVKGFNSLPSGMADAIWRNVRHLVFIFGMLAVLGSQFIFAAEQETDYELKRYRVFSLMHISAEQGKEYLAQAKIGTVSQLPDSNTLLVTGEPADLIKASTILGLVDAEEQFCIKVIFSASEAKNLPSNEQIAAEVGDISIGTFSHPPSRDALTKSIIDIHGDTVIAVAPVNRLEKIISAIERLRAGKEEAGAGKPVTEPAEAAESKEFFDKLLNSLNEAEKIAAELAAERPAVGPNLAAAVEGIKPEDTAAGAKLEPPSEPALEQEEIKKEQAVEEVDEEMMRVQPYEPKPVPSGEEMLELDLPEKLNIIDLLDLVGKYLHLDYMYDETVLAGKEVSLRLQGPIKVRDLYPLAESVLRFRGFVMTRKGNLVTIVPAEEALNIDPALQPTRDEIKFGDIIITRVFALRHIDTNSASNLLNGMKLAVNITPIAETGTLIITGYAYRMSRIEEILNMVDRPGEPRQFRFKQLKYTMAQTLAPKIKTLVEQLGTVSVTIAGPVRVEPPPPRPGRRVPPPPAPAPPTAEPTRPTVYLDADERTNRILMIGFENELDIVEGLIGALDVEQQDLRFLRLYEIQNVGAEEVVKKLQELGIVGAGRGPTTRITAGEPAKPEAPRPAATGGETQEAPGEEPQVVIIEATNSLLVNATPEQHVQIATIIGYVDRQTMEEAIPYEIYGLENQDPEDLANVLNQLIKETILDKEGKIEKVIPKKEEEITIIPDKSTFSLIVYASKKNQEWIRKLIKDLDKRRPQVLIDVSLVEITREDLFNYDLNIIANAKDFVTDNISVKQGVEGGLPISAFGTQLEGGWNLAAGKVQGFYAEDKIQALLNAMDKKDYGRVLAQPKVLVNDNEEGVIRTTEKTHVKTETISWPGDPPHEVKSVQYVPYEAKIELNITPNISEGDLLRLEINMLREDFERKEGIPPDYTTSNVTTIVTVPDGSTIILGGLTKLKQKKAGSKVPLLGDIPLAGGLFRTIANSDETSKLYIFVKANILRPDETVGLAQLQRISESNRAAFEEAEGRFQEAEDWPGIKPKPIEPLHILQSE